MTNKPYDRLKAIATIILPALATLYFGLSQIWGLSYGAEIVATITTINTFLGALLALNSKKYKIDQEAEEHIQADSSDSNSASY